MFILLTSVNVESKWNPSDTVIVLEYTSRETETLDNTSKVY